MSCHLVGKAMSRAAVAGKSQFIVKHTEFEVCY